MKNVLIIGSTGQIGSELTMKLRSIYNGNIVSRIIIPGAEPKGELKRIRPFCHRQISPTNNKLPKLYQSTTSTPFTTWQPYYRL